MYGFEICAILFTVVNGHGSMTHPTPRTKMTQKFAGQCAGMNLNIQFNGTGPKDGPCDWFSNGCQAGCASCDPSCGHTRAALGQCCSTPMQPTVTDPRLRTYKDTFDYPRGTTYYPWRSPGYAPVMNPCGVAGGDMVGGFITGYPLGFRGTDLDETKGPEWEAGSTQEVSWNIFANHGGGYSYRLCPKNENSTEECFQRTPLQFVGNTSWIQFSNNKKNRTAIEAVRTSTGTNPAGSQWTRNPIPPCDNGNASASRPIGWCGDPQFEPPLQHMFEPNLKYMTQRGLYGDGPGQWPLTEEELNVWTERFSFNIIDEVQIPANLSPGGYLLGFRYDCEQTTQVWQNCADVTIVPPQTGFLI